MRNQYDPPTNYGIPNPYGPRLHNWRGGPLNEGSLYHGPIYTRPMYELPWMRRPLNGPDEKMSAIGTILPLAALAGIMIWAFRGREKTANSPPVIDDEQKYREQVLGGVLLVCAAAVVLLKDKQE